MGQNLVETERGNTTVQLVIVFPAMMLVILLAIQAVMWSQATGLVQEAAAVGAEVSAGAGGSLASGERAAVSYLADHGLSTGVSVDGSRSAEGVVSIDVAAVPTEILGFGSPRVSASRSEPVQSFRESG